MTRVDEFRSELMAMLGFDGDAWRTRGVSIAPSEDRAGSSSASGYVVGEHFVIRCDPAVADHCTGFDPGSDAELLSAWTAYGATVGAEPIGTGLVKVLPSTTQIEDPGGVVAIDKDTPAELERLLAFLASCDPEDVDAADIYVDELDSLIRCTESDPADPASPLTAYASALPYEDVPRWWDIGVLTAIDHRRQGLGSRCVRSVIAQIQADGNEPLYRHNSDNPNSAMVAERLGFVLAVELTAIKFGEPS